MNVIRRTWLLLVICLILPAGSCRSDERPAGPSTRPVAAIERVAIVSIDGLRADLALRAKMPTLRSLMDAGSFTFWARSTDLAITLPTHVTMLTGVSPDIHKIDFNSDPPSDDTYPAVPTIFELARKAGLSTAMVAGKSKFSVLNKPRTIDWCEILDQEASDAVLAERAAKIVADHRPRLLMLHLPMVDAVGHLRGWGSPAHIDAIGQADEALGILVAALDQRKLRESTLILVTADHGGAGRMHGPDDVRSRYVPWIACGPTVRANRDLTLDVRLEVRVEDTFATACHFLGLSYGSHVEGKPILQIMRRAAPDPAAP